MSLNALEARDCLAGTLRYSAQVNTNKTCLNALEARDCLAGEEKKKAA